MVNIKGLNKAKILSELYNQATPVGLGVFQYRADKMTIEKAEELLKEDTFFDYIQGRPLKVNFNSDDFDTHLYNRDNGDFAAEKIIDKIRKKAEIEELRNLTPKPSEILRTEKQTKIYAIEKTISKEYYHDPQIQNLIIKQALHGIALLILEDNSYKLEKADNIFKISLEIVTD